MCNSVHLRNNNIGCAIETAFHATQCQSQRMCPSLPDATCTACSTCISLQEHIQVMFHQEESRAYSCEDYLLALSRSIPSSSPCSLSSSSSNSSASSSTTSSSNSNPIDNECRIKMTQWCFQVVDFAKLKRETVAVAINILDRFLSTATAPTASPMNRAYQTLHCRKKYQLACMTTLFMAIKINESKNQVDSKTFAELSRSAYTTSEIVNTEFEILQALQWRVLSKPTSHLFLQYFWNMLQQQSQCRRCASSSSTSSSLSASAPFSLDMFWDPNCTHATRIMDLCVFQNDLAVGDYYFVTQKPSVIAIASLLNAIQATATVTPFHNDISSHFDLCSLLMEQLNQFIMTININHNVINIDSIEIAQARKRLQYLLSNNGVHYKWYDVDHLQQQQHSYTNTNRHMNTLCTTATTGYNDTSMLLSSSSSKRTPSPICVTRMKVTNRASIFQQQQQ
mmetsp:Transcript_12916/g.15048  ORF Transcript_12916/g.15048 Transcript_12916/m.15048 type:complete len:452 (+) Transcript_12916:288-1643(+)